VKNKRLDMGTRNKIVKADSRAYRAAGKKGRGEILDRLEAVTGLSRCHLATKLRGYGVEVQAELDGKPVTIKARKPRAKRPEGKLGGRPREYGDEFVRVLTAIWADYGRPCAKLLLPTIRPMMDFLAASREPDYGITEVIRAQLMKVSPARADTLLAPARRAADVKGQSTTRMAAPSLRSLVPVQTYFDRATVKPGEFAFDTVAHCGASSTGQFCKTLTGTDVYSGWTEERALLNAANKWVQEAIPEVKESLPFPMTGAHYDNGMEFIRPFGRLPRGIDLMAAIRRPRRHTANKGPFAER